MRNFVPLVLAVMFAPPAAVEAFKQWEASRPPRIEVVDTATAERQISENPSICDLDDFPADRAKAMARARCSINAANHGLDGNPIADLAHAAMASRWEIAERYTKGDITAAQAQSILASKGVELTNEVERRADEMERRRLAASSAYANELHARAALAASVMPIAPLTPKSMTCFSNGPYTNCNEH